MRYQWALLLHFHILLDNMPPNQLLVPFLSVYSSLSRVLRISKDLKLSKYQYRLKEKQLSIPLIINCIWHKLSYTTFIRWLGQALLKQLRIYIVSHSHLIVICALVVHITEMYTYDVLTYIQISSEGTLLYEITRVSNNYRHLSSIIGFCITMKIIALQ